MGAKTNSAARATRRVLCSLALGVFFGVLHPLSALQNPATDGRSIATLERQANAEREANHLPEAAALYRRALALKPDWTKGWWSLGTLLYDADQYAEAAQAFEHTVALLPKEGKAFAMLGLCEAKLGHSGQALAQLDKGRSLGAAEDPGMRPVLLYTEGTLLLEKGEFGKAQDALRMLARDGAQQPELIAALGLAALGIKPAQISAADQPTRDAVQCAGDAERLAARGEAGPALEAFSKLVAGYARMHNVQFAYGRYLLSIHEDARAVEAFQKEIGNTPNHLLARLGIAGVLAATDAPSGLPYAEQAVRLAPGLAETHYVLGLTLLNMGEVARAIPELEKARSGQPDEAKVYLALSRAYTRAGRKKDAANARAAFARLNAGDAAHADN